MVLNPRERIHAKTVNTATHTETIISKDKKLKLLNEFVKWWRKKLLPIKLFKVSALFNASMFARAYKTMNKTNKIIITKERTMIDLLLFLNFAEILPIT